jgi:cbb3-type cytochrome c oxidase subunit II
MSLMKHHGKIETRGMLLAVLILITVSIGGLVEIVPLFKIETTIEDVEGVRPYSPLELVGRNIYIREGCYNCHSQQIRPFRDEIERYGHYSLAAESKYDHPFQWGSKRTGPDLARVGGKYSDDWHVAHFVDPRAVVPESIMPGYPWMRDRDLRQPTSRTICGRFRWSASPTTTRWSRTRSRTCAPRPTRTPITAVCSPAIPRRRWVRSTVSPAG